MTLSRHAVVLLAAVLLAAMAAVAATTLRPERAEAADRVTVRGCTGANVVLEAREKRMLDKHNQVRSNRGLGRLCVHPALQRAAEKHSRDMIDRDYFSHNTKGSGTTFGQRIKREGYRYRKAAENIAGGSGSYGTPNHRFDAWMNSSGHRGNILDPGLREIGIGAVAGRYKSYSGWTMWTADFGRR